MGNTQKKRLTILPSFIAYPKIRDYHLLLPQLFEYDPITNDYTQSTLPINYYENILLPLSNTKILFHSKRDRSQIHCFDTESKNSIKLDSVIQFPLQLHSENNKSSKFYFMTQIEDTESYKVKLVEINKRDPSKFKILIEILPNLRSPFQDQITRIRSNWLLIQNGNTLCFWYITGYQFGYWKTKTAIQAFCNVVSIVISVIGDNYFSWELEEDGEIKTSILGKVGVSTLDKVIRLVSNTLLIIGENSKIVISTWNFDKVIQVKHQKINHYKRNIIEVYPLTESTFAVGADNKIDIWSRIEKFQDYKLITSLPIGEGKINYENLKVVPFPRYFKTREKIVDYLQNLILTLNKDLIMLAVAFL
jgi:hypothetical protein